MTAETAPAMPSAVTVLMIIEAEIATTHLIEQVLKACGAHGIGYKKQFLDKLDADDLGPDVLPLFVRCGDPRALSWTRALVDSNRAYAYYIDDNFWRLTGNSPLASYYRHPIVRKSLEFSIGHASAVITNSKELAEFVSRFSDKVSVLPAFFDFSLIEGVQPSKTTELRIGFSGSPSRVDDLDLITPIIEPVLANVPQAVFEFAGAMPAGLVPGERIRFFPHSTDYAAYIRFQAQRNWAIGLAPLRDHEANHGKTDNKYREYGACRCAGIYSDIPPYRGVVRHGVTGLLIENTTARWLDAVTNLLEHPARRAALAQDAFEDVKERYDVSGVSRTWAQFFLHLAARSPNEDAMRVKPAGMRQRFDRWRLNLAIVYHEGGVLLVARRIAGKLRKLVP